MIHCEVLKVILAYSNKASYAIVDKSARKISIFKYEVSQNEFIHVFYHMHKLGIENIFNLILRNTNVFLNP